MRRIVCVGAPGAGDDPRTASVPRQHSSHTTLFYVINTGSTGSRARHHVTSWGVHIYTPRFELRRWLCDLPLTLLGAPVSIGPLLKPGSRSPGAEPQDRDGRAALPGQDHMYPFCIIRDSVSLFYVINTCSTGSRARHNVTSWVWVWDWVHTPPHPLLHTLLSFSPPSFHTISLSLAFTSA